MLCIKYCTMYVYGLPHHTEAKTSPNRACSLIPINQCYHQDFTEHDQEFEKTAFLLTRHFK